MYKSTVAKLNGHNYVVSRSAFAYDIQTEINVIPDHGFQMLSDQKRADKLLFIKELMTQQR
ncbi:hypothetical protein BCT04_12955 [Vibrio breoganii]|nr:hypothetical protein BCT04_12955 [Vibrio breoganii]